MKTILKTGLLICLSLNNLQAQNTLPHINLPNFNEQWRTYLDPKDAKFSLHKIIADNQKNIITLGNLLGNTNLQHLVTPNAFQTNTTNSTSFILGTVPSIIKFDSLGKKIWGTFFGKNNFANSSAIDNRDNIYVTGDFNGSNTLQIYVPTTIGAHKLAEEPFIENNGMPFYGGDGYVAKFSTMGNLIWSTLYGGEGSESINDILTDGNNNVYIVGNTNSATGISTPLSFKENFIPTTTGHGNRIGMIIKFDSTGKRVWGTYFGDNNSNETSCNNVCIDSSGNIIVVGYTNAHSGIASNGAFLQNFDTAGANKYRPFIAKFEPRQGYRLWGSYYGTAQPLNNQQNIEISAITTIGDNIFCIGNSKGIAVDLATTNAFLTNAQGGKDIFIAKFNKDGNRVWGTYYGDVGDDFLNTKNIAISKNKDALFILGGTNNANNISTTNLYNNEEINGNSFLLKMNINGQRMWGAYLSCFHNLQVPSGPNLSNFGDLISATNDGALITSINQSVRGLPIGDTTAFQNIAGGANINTTNLFTKYIDTTSSLLLQTPTPNLTTPISFEIYPNPNNGNFIISTTSEKNCKYIIYTTDGKQIKFGDIVNYYTPINISVFANGIYVIKVVDYNTGNVFVRKLVKHK